MAVFIVLWSCLFTTKLRSVIHHNLGHSKVSKRVFNYIPMIVFVFISTLKYRVSHSEMIETKWLWGIVELKFLMIYGA